MLLYPDGKTALQTAFDPVTLQLTADGSDIIASAAKTVPLAWEEFVAAAQVLVYSIHTGVVYEAETALAHAEAVLSAAENGRLDGSVLHHLRELMPLCRPMEDALPLMLVGCMMEAFRPRRICDAHANA